jgi:hypothetical protein
VSAYAFIPRNYDLRQLRGIHRTVRQLFPVEPLPPLAFPKPGQTIRLATDNVELPTPKFPKPWQKLWARDVETPAITEPVVAAPAAAPYRIESVSLAAQYLNDMGELAHDEISREAVKDQFNVVTTHFGATPDHELFARRHARYLADGEATEELRFLFTRFSWWLDLKGGK